MPCALASCATSARTRTKRISNGLTPDPRTPRRQVRRRRLPRRAERTPYASDWAWVAECHPALEEIVSTVAECSLRSGETISRVADCPLFAKCAREVLAYTFGLRRHVASACVAMGSGGTLPCLVVRRAEADEGFS